jgi:TRAP-type C4-dicarboxylate transport system permease small subunit
MILAVMLIIITINIITRYLLNYPIFWSEELSRFLFIWFGFLGAAYSLGSQKTIRFTLILDKMSPKAILITDIVTNIMLLAMFLVMLYPAICVIRFKTILTPALQVPVYYFYIIFPITLVIMIFHVGNNICLKMKKIRVLAKSGEK